jgi:hypothetical protein
MREVVISIDLGMDGAVVIHDSGIATNSSSKVSVYRMPVRSGKKPVLDITGLRNLLKPYIGYNAIVIYERIGQIFQSSKATAFSMGYQRGVMEALCIAMGFSYLDIPPKQWQTEMFTGVPEIIKTTSKKDKKGETKIVESRDTKAMAEVAIRRLNPSLTLNFPGMKKPVHDGLVDSYLISQFAIRKNL